MHVLAVTVAGHLFAWGDNSHDQCGLRWPSAGNLGSSSGSSGGGDGGDAAAAANYPHGKRKTAVDWAPRVLDNEASAVDDERGVTDEDKLSGGGTGEGREGAGNEKGGAGGSYGDRRGRLVLRPTLVRIRRTTSR